MATLKSDLSLHNLTFEDAIELALDKSLWRLLVASGATHWHGACRIMMMTSTLYAYLVHTEHTSFMHLLLHNWLSNTQHSVMILHLSADTCTSNAKNSITYICSRTGTPNARTMLTRIFTSSGWMLWGRTFCLSTRFGRSGRCGSTRDSSRGIITLLWQLHNKCLTSQRTQQVNTDTYETGSDKAWTVSIDKGLLSSCLYSLHTIWPSSNYS